MSMLKIVLASWGIEMNGEILTKAACEQIAAQARDKIIHAPIPTPTSRWRMYRTYLQENTYLADVGSIIAECLPEPENMSLIDEAWFPRQLQWSVTPHD